MEVLRRSLGSWHAARADSFLAAISARTALLLEMRRRSPLPVYSGGWSFVAPPHDHVAKAPEEAEYEHDQDSDGQDDQRPKPTGFRRPVPGNLPITASTRTAIRPRAMDFGVFAPDGTYITRGQDARYEQAGQIGVDLGCVWEGKWTPATDGCEPDADHVKVGNWKDL